jgi:hypothetical protein
MNPHFTEKENLCIARISLRASQFELRLLKQAAKAGRIPSSRTIITRSMAHAFAKAFPDSKPRPRNRAMGFSGTDKKPRREFDPFKRPPSPPSQRRP